MTFPCPRCHGRGEVRPIQEMPVYYACRLCEGTGKVSLWQRLRHFLRFR